MVVNNQLIAGGVLLAIGVIGIILSSTLLRRTITEEEHGRFGIVFDAGGSGTRMSVYEYREGSMNQVKYVECEREGIQHYKGRTDELVEKFEKCLTEAETVIPKQMQKLTPIYFKATAGMRVLELRDEESFKQVWMTIKPVLERSLFLLKEAGVFSGLKEAAYSWMHVNSLVGDDGDTSGVSETGSTSLQIAFVPEKKSELRPSTSIKVEVNGKGHEIYAHSYLCAGAAAMGRRFIAKLISDVNYSVNVEDPCMFKGDVKNFTAEEIWTAPCVTGKFAEKNLGASYENKGGLSSYKLIGTGRFEQCDKKVEDLLESKYCNETSCGLLGVYQPSSKRKFIGLSNAYFGALFLNMTSNFTGSQFQQRTKKLCETPLEEVKTMHHFSTKFSLTTCFENTYTNFLMKKVLKLDPRKKLMTFKGKINGANVGWTYGLMSSHIADMTPVLNKSSSELMVAPFVAVLVLSCITLLVGVSLLIVGVRKKRRHAGVEAPKA